MDRDELEKWFAEFWSAYPRRVGKLAAKKAFDRALNFTTPQAIKEGAERYARERNGQDQQFTKHPTTWLNAGCWDDEEGANGAFQVQATTKPRGAVAVALDLAQRCGMDR